MKYVYGAKTAVWSSVYARSMVILGILAMGLLIYDAHVSNTLMVVKWVLYSVFGIK